MKTLINTIVFLSAFAWQGLRAQNAQVSFTLSQEDSDMLIEWNTSSEVNSSFFLVEASEDQMNYKTIGSLKAAGYSAQIRYYHFETGLTGTHAFYRVTLVQMDGQRLSSLAQNTGSWDSFLAKR